MEGIVHFLHEASLWLMVEKHRGSILYVRLRDVEANENRLDMMLMHDENGNFMHRKRPGSYRKCTFQIK